MIKGFTSFLLFFLILFVNAQTITIEITDIRSSKGHLLLGVYTNDKDYQNKVAILKKTVYKTSLKEGKVVATIEGLKPGTYGIALLDDEDWDRKMKFLFFLPKEGFAFSEFFPTRIRKPHFEDFDFTLGTEDKTVIMKCKYL